ncbi:hypothetical protein L1049_025729 [Liquidambar formosana]|uniref:Uncharacterized protein n=1 Tax=Liquidambar formosana TaxID=63359 RepID=A0AAP0NC13_LIQFO
MPEPNPYVGEDGSMAVWIDDSVSEGWVWMLKMEERLISALAIEFLRQRQRQRLRRRLLDRRVWTEFRSGAGETVRLQRSFFGFLLMETFPLSFVDATGEGPMSIIHGSGEGEVTEKLWKASFAAAAVAA